MSSPCEHEKNPAPCNFLALIFTHKLPPAKLDYTLAATIYNNLCSFFNKNYLCSFSQ